jgi:hypothetical protein
VLLDYQASSNLTMVYLVRHKATHRGIMRNILFSNNLVFAMLKVSFLVQVASPEDVSNFDSTNTEAGWAGIDKRHRYASTDAFNDF